MINKSPRKDIKPKTKKIESNIKVICCAGGDEFLGHPAVYYNFGNKKQITCQYCGTIYLKSE
tara:strand:- start:48 stop:233 length:186 start_codon:yes stop_codon:yes gene_type:complete